MKRKVAFPFLTIPNNLVMLGDWLIGDPGQPLHPAGDILENWDYARNLEVSLDLSLDFSATAETLQISTAALELDAVLRAGSGTGRFPKRLLSIDSDILSSDCTKVTLSGVIPGYQLSGRLHLTCDLLLRACGSVGSPLAPSSPGSRLWSDRIDILIEDGGHSRFPVESVSFNKVFPSRRVAQSPWFVFWKDDAWDMDFGSAVRLYVNSDIEDMQARIVDGDPLTLQAILADTVSQILRAYVVNRDNDEGLPFHLEGTLGAQAQEWIEMVFPGRSMAFVRSEIEHKPGEFQATILATMAVGGRK